MAVATLNDVLEYIVTTVTNDSVLESWDHNSVWAHQAPENVPTPFFILDPASNTSSFSLGNSRTFDSYSMAIKSVTTVSDSGTADGGSLGRDAMNRLRDILVFQKPSLSSGYTMVIRESNGFEYKEAESGGNIFYHVGTYFEILLGY